MVTGSSRGAAGDRVVVAVAVVGGDPVVGAGGGGGVALGGGRAAGERLGVGEQRRAAGGRVVVEVERDGAGRVVAAADRGLVGDRSPTVALAGCWLVLIAGVAGLMVTGSAAVPLVTEALLLSPL